MESNDYQIGGKHYQSEYQHWDLVCDTDMHYLLACATKYICRWRKKNGIQDLRKASHYLAKADEEGVLIDDKEKSLSVRIIERFLSTGSPSISEQWFRFIKHMEPEDKRIMNTILQGDYDEAQALISDLIDETEAGPTAGYVNQDNNYFRG